MPVSLLGLGEEMSIQYTEQHYQTRTPTPTPALNLTHQRNGVSVYRAQGSARLTVSKALKYVSASAMVVYICTHSVCR